ncbi:MAG: hypothetical protein PUD22_10010 [Erysipelotrichaceae bacterium]|nr:hypothetical protein [Erysipelotrichaceae bacterium]
MLVFRLIIVFLGVVFYVHVVNNKSTQKGNPNNQYLVEDDEIYEDDTYQEYQEYEEEQEDVDYAYQQQDFYDDTTYDTDSYNDNSTMYDDDTYRSHFSDEERY